MSDNAPSMVVLVICDGWGECTGIEDCDRVSNAATLADTPVRDWMTATFPAGRLECGGEVVGLPQGQMGNSEVGHMNLGAGRIIYQDLTRINKAIREGTFFANGVLGDAMDACRARGATMHLLGLCSDGGVHSHIGHMEALVKMAADRGLPRVAVHCFTDGRDVSPTSGAGFVRRMAATCARLGTGAVATVTGRYYAMDRDKRWDRTRLAYEALVHGTGDVRLDPGAAVEASYAAGITDEFILPTITASPAMTIAPGDLVIYANFRADRTRQLSQALTDDTFAHFPNPARVEAFVTMTQYDRADPHPVAFAPEPRGGGLGEVLAARGLAQLRVAETEKYAHVTYFFNGGREDCFAGEDRVLVPSPKVATYDLQPEMSAAGVRDAVLASVAERRHRFVLVNFANPDMVGHTGSLEAATRAVAVTDGCVGEIVQAVIAAGGVALVTADHGNAECMKTAAGAPHTSHTLNPVAFFVCAPPQFRYRVGSGILADVAPTVLRILGLDIPATMTGTPLATAASETRY